MGWYWLVSWSQDNNNRGIKPDWLSVYVVTSLIVALMLSFIFNVTYFILRRLLALYRLIEYYGPMP